MFYGLEDATGRVTDMSLTQPVAGEGFTVVAIEDRNALKGVDRDRPHHFTIEDGVLSFVYEDE